MGHPSPDAAKALIEQGLGRIGGVNVTISMLKKRDLWCEVCCKGNIRHRPHAKVTEGRAPLHPNQLHGVDSMGVEAVPGLGREKYCTVVRDYYDGTVWCYAHKHKDDVSDVLERHEQIALVDARDSKSWHEYNGTIEFTVKAYRNDNAGEFTGSFEQARRRRKGIGTQPTVPNRGHGQQNGVAERAIAILRNLSNKLVHGPLCAIPLKYAKRLWPYADAHAAKLINIKPTKRNENSMSPAQKRYQEGRGALKKSYMERLLHA